MLANARKRKKRKKFLWITKNGFVLFAISRLSVWMRFFALLHSKRVKYRLIILVFQVTSTVYNQRRCLWSEIYTQFYIQTKLKILHVQYRIRKDITIITTQWHVLLSLGCVLFFIHYSFIYLKSFSSSSNVDRWANECSWTKQKNVCKKCPNIDFVVCDLQIVLDYLQIVRCQ